MYGTLDISTSGMIAQRTRLTAIAANISNRDAIYDANNNFSPYRERIVMMAPGDGKGGPGVHVSEIALSQAEFNMKWEPGHPYAIKEGPKAGYLQTSNVDMMKQNVDLMEATRAYEANIAAAEASKMMTTAALRLLA